MKFTEQQARDIKARLKADRHYPPSLVQIQRVVEAAVYLGYVDEHYDPPLETQYAPPFSEGRL